MDYPDRETYQKLYARYLPFLGRSVCELLDRAGSLIGDEVVDLCGGAGELSVVAYMRGASRVTWVDRSIAMCHTERLAPLNIDITPMEVGAWLSLHTRIGRIPRVIFCRQAVNYWLSAKTARLVADNLNRDGMFIFNTFNRKPSRKPTVKEYELDGAKFCEVSWLQKGTNIVHHVQCREGMVPHTTQFSWISPKHFRDCLNPYFRVEEKRDGATSIYRCIKK